MTALAIKEQVHRTSQERTKVSKVRRSATINVRVPTMLRDLIDSAAAALGKTRTDFILESARKHAVDVLLDQRLFVLNADQFEAFVRALDEKPAPNAKLKALMASKSPWEK